MKLEECIYKASVPVNMIVKHSYRKNEGIFLVIAILDGRFLMVDENNNFKFGDPNTYQILDKNDFMKDFKEFKELYYNKH